MRKSRTENSQYALVQIRGYQYFRTSLKGETGKRIYLYGKTCRELFEKELAARERIDQAIRRRETPTVAEYSAKWLLMQSAHIRATTLADYTSKVRRHILPVLGELRMGEVTPEDLRRALEPVAD